MTHSNKVLFSYFYRSSGISDKQCTDLFQKGINNNKNTHTYTHTQEDLTYYSTKQMHILGDIYEQKHEKISHPNHLYFIEVNLSILTQLRCLFS